MKNSEDSAHRPHNLDENSARERQFENLETLRRAAWEKIEARRKYDWQVSISFWGLMVSFIAALAAEKIKVTGIGCWVVAVFPFLLSFGHGWWLHGLFYAYQVDKSFEEHFREEMLRLIKTPQPYGMVELLKKVTVRRSRGPFLNWNTAPQLLTTFALWALATFLIFDGLGGK